LELRCLMSAVPTLDRSFGDLGVAAPGVVYINSEIPPAIAIESDGKILAAVDGGAYTQGVGTNLLRLNADGTLDTTFTSALPGGIQSSTMLVQSDGKIIVAGAPDAFATSSEVFRLNANGSLDTTFGVSGEITLAMGVQRVIEAPQGGLLVAGAAGTQLAVTHLNSDGSVDSTYGTAGTVTFNRDGNTANSLGATLLLPTPDGKVVLVGQECALDPYAAQGNGWILARLDADGSVDPTFNGGQPVNYEFDFSNPEMTADAKLLPDGSILIAARDTENLSLARYNFDGSLDTSFGTNGIVTASIGENVYPGPMKIQLRSTGEIFVAGFGTDFAYNDHYTPDGTLLQGEVVPSPVELGIADNVNFASALDANGDIVAMGQGAPVGGSWNGYSYPLIGSRMLPDDYVWAGDPAFQWGAYPQPQTTPPASVPPATPAPAATTAPTPQGVAEATSTTPMVSAQASMLLQLSQARQQLNADSAALIAANHCKPKTRASLRKRIAHDRSAIQVIRRHMIRLLAAEKKAERQG